MAFLLELKENIKVIFNKYNLYIIKGGKFLIAFLSLILLNVNIGYMTKIKNPLIALFVAVICAFLPSAFTVVVLSVFMLAHIAAASVELALIALCIVLLMYLLYFRFSSKYGYLLILTVVLCWMRIPAIIPMVVGLAAGISAIVPVGFGIVIYGVIRTAGAYEAALKDATSDDKVKQISYIIESFFSNKDIMVWLIAITVAMAVVYVVRRLSIDNAWTYAIIAGASVEFLILIFGMIATGAKINIVFMIIGVVLGIGLGYVCKITLFSVDYTRTEYVQYEDDEYYYYVKAVPKVTIANQDVKVKQINARKTYNEENVENKVSKQREQQPAREQQSVREQRVVREQQPVREQKVVREQKNVQENDNFDDDFTYTE